MSTLFSINKSDYVRRKNHPNVPCILCAILEGHPEVESLIVFKNDFLAVSINMYPYNPGHLMLFPCRHITDIRELSEQEAHHLHILLKFSLDGLDQLYQPHGYNIGWNLGNHSGASIAHIHQHIVPRYKNEVGFIDVIAGASIQVEEPTITLSRLKSFFAHIEI